MRDIKIPVFSFACGKGVLYNTSMRQEGEKLRLDKLLAHAGQGSRKEARALVKAGRVTVAGEVQRDAGVLVDTPAQPVCVDGVPVLYRRFESLLLHKPAGLITATEDTRLPTVGSLLSPRHLAAGIAPVGRLDRDTTGLLLLTNDGQLAHQLLSPRSHVPKGYRVTVDIPFTAEDAQRVAEGIPLSDFIAKPAQLEPLSECEALLTLTEGKFHQAKRMMHALGKEVLALHRVSFGPLTLPEDLAPGVYRPLNDAEEEALRTAVQREGDADG